MSNGVVTGYPLQWPQGRKRTRCPISSQFRDVTFGKARDALFKEVRMLGGRMPILSTDIPLRNDGLPRAVFRTPEDKGAVIYFEYEGEPMALPCDQYNRIEDNVWALKKTVENLRGIKRWGGATMLKASFQGFTALPPAGHRDWWVVLGVVRGCPFTEIKDAYLDLAKKHHPDAGGSTERMQELNSAFHDAKKEYRL